MTDCATSRRRGIQWHCKRPRGHLGECSPYTLAPRRPADDHWHAQLLAMSRGRPVPAAPTNATPNREDDKEMHHPTPTPAPDPDAGADPAPLGDAHRPPVPPEHVLRRNGAAAGDRTFQYWFPESPLEVAPE